MGGDTKEKISEAMKKGVAVTPVSVDDRGKFSGLIEAGMKDLDAHPAPKTAWTNVYRRDDWSAVALFYLDRAEGVGK